MSTRSPATSVWSRSGRSTGCPDKIADTTAAIILAPEWPGAEVWKNKWRCGLPHNLVACFQTLIGRDDISDRIGDIEVPTLVIHGEADTAITLDRAEDMAWRLPRCKWMTVPGAGHAANLIHPAPVNAAIARFLVGLNPD